MLKKNKQILIQLALLVATVLSTTYTGAYLGNFDAAAYSAEIKSAGVKAEFWGYFKTGFWYSIPFLLILTVHEFGHYFMAKYHKLKVTLPFYLPFFPPIGTAGAMIRLKSPVISKKQFFDVGIAGPLAGFVVAIGLLWYAFATLPDYQEILKIHPEYAKHIDAYGADYADTAIEEVRANSETELLGTGTNLLFMFFTKYVATHPDNVPGPFEMMHYPFLYAGYLALFFTALNLLPIGQLDGGHILYGLVGQKWHTRISISIYVLFTLWAGIGFLSPYQPINSLWWKVILYGYFLHFLFMKVFDKKDTALMVALGVFAIQFFVGWVFPSIEGFPSWLLFAFLLSRMIGVKHPVAYIEEPLDTKRKVLGWLTLVVFVLCFSPLPFQMLD